MMNKRMMLVLVVITLSLCGCETQRIEAETALTEAETELTDEQTELTKAETERETLEAFTAIIQELLSELGDERHFQRESLREVTALLEQLGGLMTLAIVGNLALTAVLMFGVIVGGIVVAVALLRRKRQAVVVLPRDQAQPWLPAGDTAIIPYQTQDTIQIVELGREIVIE
jgi:NaMN:DMB phosphoribosyltransferase